MSKIKFNLVFILIIITLIVSISGCVNNNHNTANTTKTFSSEGLTFSYPESWAENQTDFNQSLSGYNLEKLGTLSQPGEFNVFIEKSVSNASSEDYIQKFRYLNGVGINGINVTINSENRTQINGLKAYEILMTFNDPQYDVPQKVLCVLVEKDQKVYMLQFAADEGYFDEYLPVFNNVTSTINVE